MSSKENLPEIIQKNTEGIEHNDITKYTNYNFDKDFQDFDNSQDKTNDRTGGETVILEGNDYNYKDNSSIDEGLISPKQLNQTQNKNENVSIDDEDQKFNEGFFKNCNPLNNDKKLNNDNLFKKQKDSFLFFNIKKSCSFPPSPTPDAPNNNYNTIEEKEPKNKMFSIKKIRKKKNNNQNIPPKLSQSINAREDCHSMAPSVTSKFTAMSNINKDKKIIKFLTRKTKYGRKKNVPDNMKKKIKANFVKNFTRIMNQRIEDILKKLGRLSEIKRYKLNTLRSEIINNPYKDSKQFNSPIKYIYDKKSIENLRKKGEFKEINDILEMKYSEIYTIYLKGEGLDNNNFLKGLIEGKENFINKLKNDGDNNFEYIQNIKKEMEKLVPK